MLSDSVYAMFSSVHSAVGPGWHAVHAPPHCAYASVATMMVYEFGGMGILSAEVRALGSVDNECTYD